MKAIDKKDLNEMHKINAKRSKEFSGRTQIDTAMLIFENNDAYFLRTVRSKKDGYRYNVLTYYKGAGNYETEIVKVEC